MMPFHIGPDHIQIGEDQIGHSGKSRIFKGFTLSANVDEVQVLALLQGLLWTNYLISADWSSCGK